MTTPTIDRAREVHKSGRISEAIDAYRTILQNDSGCHEAWHLLGLAALHQRNPMEAVRCFLEAIKLCGNKAAYHGNLGLAYREVQETAKAFASFERALECDKQHFPSLQTLGVMHLEQGHLSLAQRYVGLARRLMPQDPNLALQAARASIQQRDWQQAQKYLDEALKLRPNWPDAMLEVGGIFSEQREFDKARDILESALQLAPANWQIACRLAMAHLELKNYERAESVARQALQNNPDSVQALNVLGVVSHSRGKFQEALDLLNNVLKIQPDFVAAHVNQGVVHLDSGNAERAIRCFESALLIDPKTSDARCNRAMALLKAGRFDEGWREYEWRWERIQKRRRVIPRPRWDGGDIQGKTILLHTEQGLGDTLQFIRYGKVLKQLGARTIAAVPSPLVSLLKLTDYLDEIVPIGSRALPSFDVHAPLLSLPAILRTEMETIPREKYLQDDAVLRQKWRERLAAIPGFRVGIVWQGSTKYGGDHHRSIPLRFFRPLSQIPGVTLISLQQGFGVEQLDARGEGFPVHVIADERDTTAGAFMDTAAIMANLDLMITSDTSIVHLAGGMGVPIWMAISVASDWRWLEHRQDCPWYPSMRLFRQNTLGDWGDVFKRLTAELSDVVAGGREKVMPRVRTAGSDDLLVPVSAGELFDKLTILEIKEERITDPIKVANVRHEANLLRAVVGDRFPDFASHELIRTLGEVNRKLWRIEDDLRDLEQRKDFGNTFVELARSVYLRNDERASLKRRINQAIGSVIVEEKSYSSYQ